MNANESEHLPRKGWMIVSSLLSIGLFIAIMFFIFQAINMANIAVEIGECFSVDITEYENITYSSTTHECIREKKENVSGIEN